eukprot:snap_masked-scaffold426_size175065-processed-gene-0.11 protein:Tk08638 transcript:snap_masked-scaffold426_size175065-processed-gene-0.11-mRNA-1 annotation:"probable reductase"
MEVLHVPSHRLGDDLADVGIVLLRLEVGIAQALVVDLEALGIVSGSIGDALTEDGRCPTPSQLAQPPPIPQKGLLHASRPSLMEGMIKLNNGLLMPTIGLGTYRIKQLEEIDTAFKAALDHGYKLIDTASVYKNERRIAATLKTLNVDRTKLFLTSKLAPNDHGTEKAKAAVEKSLRELDTSYLDLYLIHWPGVQGLDPQSDQHSPLRLETWRVLEDFHRQGVLKAIGVSNYEISHLKELLDQCQVKPQVNQIEVHPHYQQRELVQFCRDHDIHVTAYSSLGRTVEVSPLLTDPIVTQIAQDHSRSPAQILLKWAILKGLSVLPKSINPQHIQDNIQLDFELKEDAIQSLDNLEVNTKYAWNPKAVV